MNRFRIGKFENALQETLAKEMINEIKQFIGGMFRLNDKAITDNAINWFSMFLTVHTSIFNDSLCQLLSKAVELNDLDVKEALYVLDTVLAKIREETLKQLETRNEK